MTKNNASINNRIMSGHVDPWWDNSFKDLDYERAEFPHTTLKEKWINEGYDRFILNGGVYSSKKPLPEYASRFKELFDWDNIGITFFEMFSMEALPLHSDTYPVYIKMNNIQDTSKIWRAIVLLEDWKSGHYLEVGGTAFVNWQAGDWVAWNWDTPHYAANIGLEPRYTVQITGTNNN
jgi:hypothetical protein